MNRQVVFPLVYASETFSGKKNGIKFARLLCKSTFYSILLYAVYCACSINSG